MTEDSQSNQSLLLEKLDGGSSTLPVIFQYVTSLKEKIRLQRVCRSFRKHARSFQAWSDVKNIVIKGVPYYWVNNDRIPREHLKIAIESIIFYSQNIHVINLRHCDNLAAYTSVVNSFAQARTLESPNCYRNVHRILIGGQNSAEISALILLLIDSFKNQLKCLKLSHIAMNANEMAQLWATIKECVNLEYFAYFTTDEHISAEMVKSALRGKEIHSLYLNLPCLKTPDRIEIIASFKHPQCLEYLIGNSLYMSLADIAHNLPAVHWSNVTKILFYHFDSLSNTAADWQVILRLPLLAPKLTNMSLKLIHLYSSGFELSQATELIVAYLDILNQRDVQQSDKFTLCLLSKASFSATVSYAWDWEKVMTSLANERNCETERISAEIFRIRSAGSKSSAVIELNNKL